MSYLNRLSQNITVDSNNSSILNLNAGNSFVGKATDTTGVSGIQVTFKADQNCTLYADQSSGYGLGGGTVTTDGTINLIGLGTNFLSRRVGDQILVNGETERIIASIISDTSLTVTDAFSTSTGGLTYQMYNWDISDSYDFLYSIANFGGTIQAVASYVRVRATNISASATTYLRLNTILCPVVEAVPRSLDKDGYLKTSVKSLSDGYGFIVENTPIGEQRTVIPTRLVGAAFDGTTVDPNFWAVTNLNSGTTTQANSQIVLATNTTANGTTILNSTRRARYTSASSMTYRSIIQLSTGVTNNKRRWGIAYGSTMPTITDGAYFQLNGSTFSVVVNKGGSETIINSGSFNGNIGAVYSPGTSVITYEIYWTNSSVWFVVGDELLHKISASTFTWSATMNHYIYMDNVNSSGITSNNTLTCRVASIRRLGQLLTQPTSKYQSGTTAGIVCKYSSGNLHSIIISGVVSGSVVTLYDGTSTAGTIIWASGSMTIGNQATNLPFTLDFKGLPFSNGLFLVIATQNSNVTIVYE